ncbi:DNase I-like protein [Pseudovirgaria hyperparasitica]|uniref:DNase I-like protein n=1 Tax=Pseudovirgaria hyperparasitica TaxID=470096 RepID=A0A6A6W7L2_9PEZI|nr:DNase I-like protein [Pseudovirgaria hyperparasitica]KAF2758852.1 DNase I-like protein [Pseudovirgaria hyperparasitica]
MSSLELYLITFNCGRALVEPSAFAPHLFDALPKNAALPDIIAISLQEIAPISYSFLGGSFLNPYFDRIDTSVHLAAHHLGGDSVRYESVFQRNMGMTALVVYAKEHIVPQITRVQSAATGVGFWDMGNKGAVGAILGLKHEADAQELDLTFIAAHLAPMEEAVQRRNEDWKTIVRTLVFVNDDLGAPSKSVQMGIESRPILRDGDDPKAIYHARGHVFFCGDLNYRTSDAPPESETWQTYPKAVESEASPVHFAKLLAKDQLTREMKAGRTCHGFEELPITFPPTYKLSHKATPIAMAANTGADSSWQWAKHRFPSWCDRCLYLPPPKKSSQLQLRKYTSLAVQPTSDHRPVALSVTAPLEAWQDPDPEADDIRLNPPFSIDPQWQSRYQALRRYEVVVGVLAYLTTTKEGLAMFVASVGGIAALSLFLRGYGR